MKIGEFRSSSFGDATRAHHPLLRTFRVQESLKVSLYVRTSLWTSPLSLASLCSSTCISFVQLGTDRRDVNFGAAVYSNTFGGADMTFGMAVAGVQDWSVTENTALASARFRGSEFNFASSRSFSILIDPSLSPLR